VIAADSFSLLAYPTIDPPYKLLAKGLLYAEKLGTLTPQGFGPDLAPAVERKLYVPLSPWEILDDDTDFTESLVVLIERLRAKHYLDPSAEPKIIRAGKLPDTAIDALVRSGAAEKLKSGHLAGDPALVLATLSLTAQMTSARLGHGWISDTIDRRIHDALWAPDVSESTQQKAHLVPTISLPIPAGLSVPQLLELRDRESDNLIRQIKDTARLMTDANAYQGKPGRLQRKLDVLGYELTRSAGSQAGLIRAGLSCTLVTVAGLAASSGLTDSLGVTAATTVVGIGTVGQAIMARRHDHKDQVILSNVTG
jgi:hypothetical protein